MDERYSTLYRCAFSSNPPLQHEIDEIKGLYESEGRKKIKQTIQERKFVPFVSNLLVEIGYTNEGWEELREFYSNRNTLIIRALDKLYTTFDAFNVDRVVVVENFGAFLAAGAEPIWRFGSGDVNLYADICQRDIIYEAARSAGYVCEEQYSGNNLISTCLKNIEELSEGFYFDIGWYPTVRMKIPFLIYTEEAVDWYKMRFFSNTRIRLPDKESLLYICMLHISVHSFSRQPDIRLYIDIQNLVKDVDVDWDKIIRWAKRDGYTNRIATVVYLTQKLIDVEMPDSIVNLCDTANHRKLLDFVYDAKKNILISKPRSTDSLRIEMYANDRSALCGLAEILFPKRSWLKQTFGDNLFMAYVKYIVCLLR